MTGPNARYALPPEDRLPAHSETAPGGADEGQHAFSPAAAAPLDQTNAPDRTQGLALEVDAIGHTVAELRRLIDQVEQNSHELDSALAERQWGVLNSAAIRLHALAGHLVKAIERRPRRAARKAA